MIKLFISQPMKDRTQEEILKEREEIIAHCKDQLAKGRFGVEFDKNEELTVLESYFEDYKPEGGCVALKYLAKSLELLADADIAYFAKGWDQARGCKVENTCAIEYSIPLVVEDYKNCRIKRKAQ